MKRHHWMLTALFATGILVRVDAVEKVTAEKL
jgi:hypothetical protein